MVKKKLPKKIKDENGKYTQYDFNNADDFYDVLSNFNDTMDAHLKPYHPTLEGQKRWIFRGHWHGDWGLLPGAFRPSDKNKNEWYERFILKPHDKVIKSITNSRPQITYLKNVNFIKTRKKDKIAFQVLTECFLLEWFMDTANSLGIECNYNSYFYEYYNRINPQDGEPNYEDFLEWPHRKLWPLIASAQHHGLPTRFLDFSYNPFFAMFFATSYPFFDEYVKQNPESKKNDEKLCVWAIDKINITKMINTKSEADENLSNNPLQEKRDTNNPLQEIPVTNNRSSNLFSQEGILLLDTEANQKFILNNNEWQGLETMGEPDSFIKLTLPQSKYKDLLRRLWENDITPARIMPNLDRVTETLEYKKWLWTEK